MHKTTDAKNQPITWSRTVTNVPLSQGCATCGMRPWKGKLAAVDSYSNLNALAAVYWNYYENAAVQRNSADQWDVCRRHTLPYGCSVVVPKRNSLSRRQVAALNLKGNCGKSCPLSDSNFLTTLGFLVDIGYLHMLILWIRRCKVKLQLSALCIERCKSFFWNATIFISNH